MTISIYYIIEFFEILKFFDASYLKGTNKAVDPYIVLEFQICFMIILWFVEYVENSNWNQKKLELMFGNVSENLFLGSTLKPCEESGWRDHRKVPYK